MIGQVQPASWGTGRAREPLSTSPCRRGRTGSSPHRRACCSRGRSGGRGSRRWNGRASRATADPAPCDSRSEAQWRCARSIRARLSGRGCSSPTFSHRNGMARIWQLTLASSSVSVSPRGDRPLTPTRSSPRRFAALPGRFQDGGRSMPSCCASALPTSPRNIEPRWFPLQELAVPRCCASRCHSVLRVPAVTPWVPTRTMRNPLPDLERSSPSSQKK